MLDKSNSLMLISLFDGVPPHFTFNHRADSEIGLQVHFSGQVDGTQIGGRLVVVVAVVEVSFRIDESTNMIVVVVLLLLLLEESLWAG